MNVNWATIRDGTIGAILTAMLLPILAFCWNLASSGWFFDQIVVHSPAYLALNNITIELERKLKNVDVADTYFRIRVKDVIFELPDNGNMTVGFNDGYSCFSAIDRGRPNGNDLKRCFFSHK